MSRQQLHCLFSYCHLSDSNIIHLGMQVSSGGIPELEAYALGFRRTVLMESRISPPHQVEEERFPCLSKSTVEKSEIRTTIRENRLDSAGRGTREESASPPRIPTGLSERGKCTAVRSTLRAVGPSESSSALCPAGREDRAGLDPWVLVSQVLTRRKGRERRDDYSFMRLVGHRFERLLYQVLLN